MFPIKGENALLLAVVFGFAFGWLLQRGKVTNYNVIVNQFRFRDFTVLKVMMTAIIVGGIGVLVLTNMGMAKWHVRDANMLGTIIGAAIFGVGMVLYGYCPGTGVAAIATGSIHALIGAAGMILGAVLYAFSFEWVRANILSVGKLGKVTLPQIMHLPAWTLYGVLIVIALALFYWVEKRRL
ncbi:YeeE/YedE thiosulfate transporter family protein [Zwartia sp.]|uniref:YeeE/YedE thiosulfate transporter family protein n=1 Tax=Zwartia sp. TaxID=2978004 RepID=UPI002720B1E7|nr:YeeE/YedE thiosulfate transporter family protein [Zwartia sp.]MDO9024236.1 YeeE/YedE thiosulfate transporter family protein [Zwartia sp.]